MASDYTPTNVTSGFQMEVTINTNLNDIKTAIDKALYRTITVDNAMSQDIDMNGNNLINLPFPGSNNSALRLQELLDLQALVNVEGADLNALVVLSGVPATSTNLGSFPLDIITAGSTIKEMGEDLEDYASKTLVEKDTLADLVASSDVFEDQVVFIKERTTGLALSSSKWKVVLTSSVTPNTYNIVISTAKALLSFVLIDIENPRAYGLKGDGTDEDLIAAQTFFTTTTSAGLACDFKDGVYRIGDITLVANCKVLSTEGTIKPASTMSGSHVFNGTVDGLDMRVNFETDDDTHGLLKMDGGVSPLISLVGLNLDCEILDSGTGALTEDAISLIVRLQYPVIKVKGTASFKNVARLVHNAHGTGDDTNHRDLDIWIDSKNWSSGWIHEGTGFATGVNIVRYAKVEGAAGGVGTQRVKDALSTYHMRNLVIGKIFSIDCDRLMYIWTPVAVELLYASGYTGSNSDDSEQTPMLIESQAGVIDKIQCEDSLADGMRHRFGGQIQVSAIHSVGNAGWAHIVKYDLAGGARVDLNIGRYHTRNNGKGSLLVERTTGASNGLRAIDISCGQSIDNNQIAGTDPDIYIKGAGNGIRAHIRDTYSDGSNDTGIKVDGDGDYSLVEVSGCDVASAGSDTIAISGTSTGGRRIIRDNTVDSRTKMSISGGAGTKIFHLNYGITEGDITDGTT